MLQNYVISISLSLPILAEDLHGLLILNGRHQLSGKWKNDVLEIFVILPEEKKTK